jgi:hypothetical protein
MKIANTYYKVFNQTNNLVLVSTVTENIFEKLKELTDNEVEKEFVLPNNKNNRFFFGCRIERAKKLNVL